MVLNMGPQHPSTHGVLRVVLELDGEIVLSAQAGDRLPAYRASRNRCESKTYSQCITLTDRIDYLAPLSNNLGYCLAAEKLIGLEVPKRAQYIRVLLTELTRITSHLVWLGTHAIDLGAMSVFLYSFREREEIMKIYEYVSGQRMMTSYFRIGGLALEPPPDWLDRVRRVIDALPAHIDEYETLLTQNRIWMARTKGVGNLSAEDAIATGRFRPAAARQRRGLRHSQGFPVFELRRIRFRRADADRRRLLRAIPGARGRNAREPEDRPPGDGQNSRRGPVPRRSAGHHSAVARRDEDLDRRPDLPFQDFHRRIRAAAGRGLSARSNRRAANWAFSWPATARRSRIA